MLFREKTITREEPVKLNPLSSLYPVTRQAEQIDKYGAYLSGGDILENILKNPRNLFHELNTADTKWLKVARMHLSRSR